MYSEWGWLVVFVWLGGLTFLVLRSRSTSDKSSKILKSVFEEEGEGSVKLDQLIRKINGLGNQFEEVKERVNRLAEEGVGHVQRLELLRFNPYDDTGGDQSFTVALLDKDGTGVVVTSLHSRSNTRVFAKPVNLGKPDKFEFSKEEEQVVKKAMGR